MARRKRKQRQETAYSLPAMSGRRGEVVAFGGGMEGAERNSRETALWFANRGAPDQLINFAKEEADARGRDMVLNDGFTQGVVDLYRNGIVGTQYRLNAQPNWQILSRIDPAFDETWAGEFQEYVEETFNLIGDSENCWLDAARRLTFTGQIRMAIAGWAYTGEDLATAEWIREVDRPFNTAVQHISPSRLSNPNGLMDTEVLRRGVRIDDRGKPIGYWIQIAEPNGIYNINNQRWTFVPAAKNLVQGAPPFWNRKLVLHSIDPVMPGQTRAVSELVAVLKTMRMTKKFQEIVLQNAVINASYAATVESEFPSDVVTAMLGGGAATGPESASAGILGFYQDYLVALRSFLKEANGVAIDGAKIPHLFPGTKLNARPLGTPGGVGTEFEASLLRHIAAGLGVSYEELSNDFTRTNYSSGQMAGEKTRKHMQAKKKTIADRRANWTYALWMEEDLALGNPPLPAGWGQEIFYEPLAKEALTSCDWIGSGRGQIDELKETQAAMLRIKAGLSTHEIEHARMGYDWRKIFAQQKREQDLAKELELAFSLDAQQNQQGVDTQGTLTDGTSGNDPSSADSRPIHITLEQKRGTETTRVTKWDEDGRIMEYERFEE
jgi:lambda family phage portal protein